MYLNRKKPTVNAGYGYGQHNYPLVYAEEKEGVSEYSPHEKGEFRKAYWRGRISNVVNFDLLTCVRYLKLEQLITLVSRLEEVYRQTLIDVYGVKGANDFLAKHNTPSVSDSDDDA